MKFIESQEYKDRVALSILEANDRERKQDIEMQLKELKNLHKIRELTDEDYCESGRNKEFEQMLDSLKNLFYRNKD